VRISHSSLPVAVIALVAACTGDAVLTAPSGPTTPLAAGQPEMRRVVIDSTHLAFAGTAADRAAGHYVFEIRDSAPALAPGDYVAGRQGGLFLGRVRSASTSGGLLTLELAPAAFSDVFPPVKIHIPFTPGAGSAPSPYGVLSWGPWEPVSRPGQKLPTPTPGRLPAPLPRAGPMPVPVLDTILSFLLSNFDLCAASGLVTGCVNVTAKVISGNFSFHGGVDVDVFPTFPPLGIAAQATVNEQLSAAIDFQLTGNGSVEVDIPIPELAFVRKFKSHGLSGEIELGVIVGVEGDIKGTTIEPHVHIEDTVTAGAKVSTAPSFATQFDPHIHFDAGAKVVDLGDLGVKLSLGPKVSVRLDVFDGKFELEAAVDRFEEVSENLTGALQFQNWHVHVAGGKEGSLTGILKVPFFGFDQLGGTVGIQFDTLSLVDLWGTGDLEVVSTTAGKDVWPFQTYFTSVARTFPAVRPPWYRVLATTLGVVLGVNDSHLFRGGFLCHQFLPGAPVIVPSITDPQDCDLVATIHSLSPLSGIAWNCNLITPLPSPVTLRPRNPFDFFARLTTVSDSVFCRSAYAVVRDTVAAMLADGRINIGGIATSFDAKLTAAEIARDAGDPAGADSALVDLANELRAQNGKHITTTADTELQSYDTLLRTCYETVVPTCSSVPPPAPVALRSRVG
jgi:hypothetical protein